MTNLPPLFGFDLVESERHQASLLAFHGTHAQLVRILGVLQQQRDVISICGPEPCTTDGPCWSLEVVVFDQFTDNDMTSLMTGLGFQPPPAGALN